MSSLKEYRVTIFLHDDSTMGIYLSTTATSPFFLTSGIIGFVSFAFTLGTFIRVLWSNFSTLGEAPHEVHTYLTNLRTELLEERANLKVMKKMCKKHHRMVSKNDGRWVIPSSD
ncbi:hypothetical protein KC361_g66 [Hortaea werneckii]|nr:hypothetical protein KC361_g66 [Hortaea werneckii]